MIKKLVVGGVWELLFETFYPLINIPNLGSVFNWVSVFLEVTILFEMLEWICIDILAVIRIYYNIERASLIFIYSVLRGHKYFRCSLW